MERRAFITLLGGAAVAWPVAAHAQQPAMPVVGYLNLGSPESDASRLTGIRQGLYETSYVEGRNLIIEYRWAGNQADRLQALAADLVQLRVAVIVSPGLLSTLAAQAATTKIPIVFVVSNDPRCKVHGGKSTGPLTREGLERSRRANWKHGYFSWQAKAERSRLRAAILALRDLCHSI
jgi:ABC-type uncharacterized transport system substrate-binding protein